MSAKIATESAHDDKLLGIELLRFASAVAVLVFHFQHFAFIGTAQASFVPEAQPFFAPLELFYQYGSYGVQVFWCISGFIFYWKYATQIADKKVGAYAFFILRLSRLYPLHLITLLFMAAAQYWYFKQNQAYFVYQYNDAYHFILQLFMASDWGIQAGESFNGPIWSISIEVLVYTLFFLSLLYLSASLKTLAAILVGAAAVIALKLSAHPFFECVLFFYAGCFTAVVFGAARNNVWLRRTATIGSAAILVGLPLVLFWTSLQPRAFLFVYSPALIYLAVAYVRPTGPGVPVLAAAGNITYASYLLHVPMQISVCLYYSSQQLAVPWQSPMFFLIYMIAILALSLWCHAYFEMPMQSILRRRLLKRDKPNQMESIPKVAERT